NFSRAETKKRRASVFSEQNLFIPKQLARSELQFRTRKLSNTIPKKKECHLRMLKFPLDSSRVRYVVEKMKKEQSASEQPPCENQQDTPLAMEDINSVHIKQEEFVYDTNPSSPELPMSMPDLETETVTVKNQLPENEDSINLFDLVKKEAEDEDSFEDPNIKLLQSQRQSVIKSNFTKGQNYPYLNWHQPQLNLKMEVLEEYQSLSQSENEFINNETTEGLHYNEVTGPDEFIQELPSIQVQNEHNYQQKNIFEEQQEPQDLQMPDQILPVQNVQIVPDQEQPHNLQITHKIQTAQDQQMTHIEPEPEAINFSQSNQQNMNAQNQVAELPTTSINTSSGPSTLRQHLIHHIVRPRTFKQDISQPSSINNNAIGGINQNIATPHHVETPTMPTNNLSQQWNSPSFAPKPHIQTQQQQVLQQHPQQHPQFIAQQQHPPQQKQEIIYNPQQNDIQLQELKVLYQRLECRENNEMIQIGQSLTRVLEERLAYELQHAEEKRQYLEKMEKSKKMEEKLKAQKEQVQRQIRADLRILEQRIADKQRQQEEHVLAWSWQHRQQQQQPNVENLQRLRTLTSQPAQVQQQHQQRQEHQLLQQPQQHQQHRFLFQPPTYIYPSTYQDPINYQQVPANSAESHVPGPVIELRSRLWIPPPPYCPTSHKSLDETPKEPPKKPRQRRKNTEKRTAVAPYTVPTVQSEAPANPVQEDTAQHPEAAVPEQKNENITTVMENYVSNYLNKNMRS
ncbi:hypothetical protein KR074_012621, partial [Drosophila pseudoananassae]